MEPIITRTATHCLEVEGFVRSTLHPKMDHVLVDAVENVKAVAQTCAGKNRPHLVDARQLKSQDRDARNYYIGPESMSSVHATAMLIGSPMSRLMGNFFMGFNKSIIPFRLFTSEQEAIAWLKTFLS